MDGECLDKHLKPLAIFDLDRTLLEGDNELIWSEFLASRNLVGPEFIDKFNQFHLEYDKGTIIYSAYVKHLLKPIIGFSNQKLQMLLGTYIEILRPLIRPRLIQRVEHHRFEGCAILLATSTNSILAEPIARMLEIDNLVCTVAEIINEVPTGNFVGLPAFRQGKVTKVKNWIKKHPITLEGSWCYSDSYNDLPIMQLVQTPVAVSPDNKLRIISQENGWQIMDGRGNSN